VLLVGLTSTHATFIDELNQHVPSRGVDGVYSAVATRQFGGSFPASQRSTLLEIIPAVGHHSVIGLSARLQLLSDQVVGFDSRKYFADAVSHPLAYSEFFTSACRHARATALRQVMIVELRDHRACQSVPHSLPHEDAAHRGVSEDREATSAPEDRAGSGLASDGRAGSTRRHWRPSQ